MAVESAAKRAAELTKQLLGFARRGQHMKEPVNMVGVIRESVGLLTRTLGRDIEIVTHLNAKRSTVVGDVAQLKQVIDNLAVNARDAMPDGGRLTIETENVPFLSGNALPHSGSDAIFRMRVSDTGCGIEEKHLRHVFEPFFTTKDKAKGLGLGLSMVYGIVANHGGTVSADGEEGKGSVFTVLLPCAPEEVEVPDDPADPVSATARLDNIRVMVVDDEPLVAALAKDILERAGCRVEVFTRGEAAVEHYCKYGSEIDLVVQDMEMPGMSGGDCFRKLQEINTDVKVVLATGYGRNEKAQGLLDEGMQALLTKPYSTSEMCGAIGSVLVK